MDYLLDDLYTYTMEKVAAEELGGKERYEQEMEKARKRQIAGRVALGAGAAHGLHNWGSATGKMTNHMFEAMKDPNFIEKSFEGPGPVEQKIMKTYKRRGLVTKGLLAAGIGTSIYNKRKKKQEHDRYMKYLEDVQGSEEKTSMLNNLVDYTMEKEA